MGPETKSLHIYFKKLGNARQNLTSCYCEGAETIRISDHI